jgi:hypothetical protein
MNTDTSLAVIPGGDFGAVQQKAQEGGIEAAQSREVAQVRTAAQMAMMSKRNESEAWAALIKSSKRPSFAEKAEYQFPRGGAPVRGPSVHMAREAARLWGNIRTGIEIVSSDDLTKQMHVRGFAWDMQTNAYISSEAKFRRSVQRKRKNDDGEYVTQWVEPDERDLRELVNKHGAICVRNSILQLLPTDLIEDAVQTARNTLLASEANSLKEDRTTTVKKLIMAFDGFAVSVKMLDAYLGHPIAEVTPKELADLRAIFTSIKDGNSRREDHFGGNGAPVPQDKTLDEAKERLKGKNGKAKAAEPEPLKMTPEESARLEREAMEADEAAGRG